MKLPTEPGPGYPKRPPVQVISATCIHCIHGVSDLLGTCVQGVDNEVESDLPDWSGTACTLSL